MKFRLFLLLIFFVIVVFDDVALAGPKYNLPTHCVSGEQTYFSCQIKGGGFVGSLCGRWPTISDSDLSDILVDYRYGEPGKVSFKYPEAPVSLSAGKFFGHHEKPYLGGYVSDEVSFYIDDVMHGVYVLNQRDSISGSVIGKGQRASLCVAGSITNSLWQLIISLPSSAKN